MGEHDDRHPAAGCRVVRSQQSPEGRPRPEQLEVVAGHEQSASGDGVLHDRDVLRGGQAGEAACLRLQRLIVGQAEPLAARGLGVPTQRVQRMRVGQVDGLEQVGVENREGGARQPEAESDGRRDCRHEQRRPAKRPDRVAHVLPQRLQQRESLSIAIRLGRLQCAAEPEARRPASVRERHPAIDIVRGGPLEIGRHLV